MFAEYLLVFTLVIFVVAMMYNSWPKTSLLRNKVDSSYDYIIVGAGSAGCVLANRLSLNTQNKVLLVEAGDEETNSQTMEIPLVTFDMQRTDVDWLYTTTPQKYCCSSYENKVLFYPRGKVFGGTSSMNYMIYMRGNSADYDGWALGGADGWSYEDVLPYFKKSENNKNPLYKMSGYHGTEGPLYVTDMRQTKVVDMFLGAAKELGQPLLDVNGKEQIGFSASQGTIYKGKRQSTAVAYLRPIIHRMNLHTITKAHVTKVIIKSNIATGIQFIKNNTLFTVKAKKEVILSAGTMGSPLILMRSGVGPKQHLESHGIPVVANLPVGNNLQDHIYPFGIEYFLRDKIAVTENSARGLFSLIEYLLFGKGILATSGMEANGFMRAEHQPVNVTYPYLQFEFLPLLVGSASSKARQKLTKSKLNYRLKIFEALYGDMSDKHGVMMLPILLHPKSIGTIRLNSNDPFDKPLIDPNFLEEEQDRNILLEGVRFVQKMAKTRAFKMHGAKPTNRIHPLCKDMEEDSDEYWLCFIKETLATLHHPVGTCKMGGMLDPTTVVDPQLRVKGVKKLRVADASVMPRIISGNTNIPTIMIAEKAFDLITGKISVDKDGKDLEKPASNEKHMHEAHGEL